MRTRQPATATLENLRIPVQAKLAAAWTSFMFLYVYVDFLNFFKPGVIDDILAGIVFEFDICQTFVDSALTLMAIPILMVLLSMTLPARANRINLIVASFYIPVTAFNAVGESWTLLLRPWHRTGIDPSRPHPAVRLDLAPHRTVGDHGDQPGP